MALAHPTHRPPATRAAMLDGTPLTERRLRPCDISTAVLEAGDGPPLVLLQGGIECGAAYWAPVASGLAAHRRVIAPDAPGLGESEPVGRLDGETFDDWFAALLDLTCDEPPDLVAHSLLGTAAARFAVRHGDRLRRLVIYGAPGVGPYRMPLGLRVVAVRFGLRPTPHNAERFERWAFADLDRARRTDPEWFAAFSDYTRSRATVAHTKKAMRQLIRDCTRRVPDSDLRRIETPTALLWGRHDRFVDLGLATAAAARLGWPLRVIDDAGHVPHIEQPAAFVRAVLALTAPARTDAQQAAP